MPSCMLVDFEQVSYHREVYLYAVTNEEIRVKDRYNSLVASYKSDWAIDTIANSKLLHISFFVRLEADLNNCTPP